MEHNNKNPLTQAAVAASKTSELEFEWQNRVSDIIIPTVLFRYEMASNQCLDNNGDCSLFIILLYLDNVLSKLL